MFSSTKGASADDTTFSSQLPLPTTAPKLKSVTTSPENWWDEVEGERITESAKNTVMQGPTGNISEDMSHEMDNETNSFDQLWDSASKSEPLPIKNTEKSLPPFTDVLKESLREMSPSSNIGNASNKHDVPSKSQTIDGRNRVVSERANVFETLFEEDREDPGEFPIGTACPYMGMRKFKSTKQQMKQKENVSCVAHVSTDEDCQMANKEYRNHQKIPQCNEGPEKDICSIEETWRASPESKLTIQCDLLICKGHPVSVTGIHPLEGVVDKEKEGYTFNNSTALERFLGHFVIVNTLRKFSFCFLRCKTGRKKYAQQILMFPPLLDIEDSEFLPDKKDPSLININIVMLDSVSRAHFYRSLPKTVSTLRNIVYNKSINATVLDFELLQSSAPFTFHNIRAFMSGKSDFDYIEHSNGTYQIEVLYKKMKNQGYYTLLQEDSCWFDEWGSLFTNNIFQNKTPHSRKEFQNRWSGFQDVVNGYHVDDYGLSYSSCDVFKQYNVTNQFNRPLKICFGGKVYSELFLDYSLSVFQGYIDSGKRQPIFAYTHLNAGHEVTGTRIRQIDYAVSGYLHAIAHEEDTLTLVFSDHGPKTTKFSFQTMEGRGEIYDSLLFAIVPENVANILGLRRMRAMITNQKRLLTTLDLHNTVISIGDSERSTSDSYLKEGLFSEIPANRTCADLSIKPSAVCKCEGWDQKFPDNDPQFIFLAEFGLGLLNNKIQDDYLTTPDAAGGFGKCQRLVGHRFEKIRRRKVGEEYFLTMDLIVLPGKEIFEIQLRYPLGVLAERRKTFPALMGKRRVSIYRKYEKCVDEHVKVQLCVCDSHHYGRNISNNNAWKWFEVRTGSEVLETVFRANSFGTNSEVKDLSESCLLLVTRKRKNLSVAFEVANACKRRRYKVRITGRGNGKTLLTRKLPFSIMLEPNTVHFALSVHYVEKPYGFYLKTSFVGYNV